MLTPFEISFIIHCKVKILYTRVMNLERNDTICNLIETYGKLLTIKQQNIVKDYYFYNLSYSEIAENYNVTRQAVKDIIDRSIKQCVKLEDNLSVLKKQKDIVKSLNDVMQDLKDANTKEKLRKIIENLEG